MRQGGRIAARVMAALLKEVRVGVALSELDKLAEQMIGGSGAEPAFLGYRPAPESRPYPATICASVGSVIVHGTPGAYRLQDGDVLKIDFGVKYQGYYTDTAITVAVSRESAPAQKLLRVTQEALRRAIIQCRPGHTLGDIGWTVANWVRKNGLSVVEGLVGHGIGRELHEAPEVPNSGRQGGGMPLEAGMVLAIEPMVSLGGPKIVRLKDESYATADGSLAAHFEHTVAITKSDPEILTVI